MIRKATRVLAYTALTSLVAATATASPLRDLTYMSPEGRNVVWPRLPLKLCVSKDVPAEVREPLAEAVKVWNTAFKKPLFDLECPPLSATYAEGDMQTHGVYWITEGFEKFTDKTSLARTRVDFTDSGQLVDADLLINAQYYDWKALPIDAQTVLVHELGHALGLKHNFLSLDSAMNYFPYVSGYVHRGLGEYEKRVVARLYFKSKERAPLYLRQHFQGRNERAIKTLERVKRKSPEQLYALATLYKFEKKYDRAKELFLRFLELEPKSSFVRQQLGEVLWSANDEAGAEREFLKVIEENPASYESFANLGALLLKRGDKTKGLEYLKKSLALQPAHWVACSLLLAETKDETYKACLTKYGPEQ